MRRCLAMLLGLLVHIIAALIGFALTATAYGQSLQAIGTGTSPTCTVCQVPARRATTQLVSLDRARTRPTTPQAIPQTAVAADPVQAPPSKANAEIQAQALQQGLQSLQEVQQGLLQLQQQIRQLQLNQNLSRQPAVMSTAVTTGGLPIPGAAVLEQSSKQQLLTRQQALANYLAQQQALQQQALQQRLALPQASKYTASGECGGRGGGSWGGGTGRGRGLLGRR